MKMKIIEWVKRYATAEVFALIGAFLGASVGLFLTNNLIVSAYCAAFGENIFYYGLIIIRDVRNSHKEHKKNSKKYGFLSFVKNNRDLIVEFGPAETLDSLVIRPFWMYLFPIVLGNFYLGILVGKLVADITFYGLAIIGYEFRKKYLK